MNSKPITKITFLSMLLCSFMGLGVDMILPSLGDLSIQFHLSPGNTQLIISTFIFSFAIMQLIQGILSDYLGRKIALIFSLLIFTLSSFASSWSSSFLLIIIFRCLQAFGVACAVVTAYALIRDYFEGDLYSKAMSYVIIARSLFPISFSIIGGAIAHYSDWNNIFFASGSIGLLVLLQTLFTLKKDNKSTKKIDWRTILSDYKTILKNKIFLIYNFLGVAEFTMLLVYLTALPFIFKNNVSNNTLALGFYIGLNSLFLALGSWIATLCISKISYFRILVMGLSIMIVDSFLIFSLNLYESHNSFITLLPLYLFSIGCGITSPISMSLLLKPFKNNSAQASALTGFLRFFIASVFLNFVLHFKNLEVTVGFVILIFSIGSFWTIYCTRNLNLETIK